MTKSCDSSPSVIPTSSGSLWFVDRDWKIVCSNNHKSNNPPLLLVEAASFDASLPSLQHRPFQELWILAGWKTTFTFEWTLGDYSQGIWWYMIPGWMLFRHVPPISGSHLAHHSRPSTISRRLHICNRQGSSLQVSWSRLPNLLEHIPPKKSPNKGNIFCYRMDTYMEYMETNGVILPLNHRQLSFLVSSWCSSGCMSWSSLTWWFPKSWGHPQIIQVIRPWLSMT